MSNRWQTIKYLSYCLLSPRVHMDRKLETEAIQLGLNSRCTEWHVGHCAKCLFLAYLLLEGGKPVTVEWQKPSTSTVLKGKVIRLADTCCSPLVLVPNPGVFQASIEWGSKNLLEAQQRGCFRHFCLWLPQRHMYRVTFMCRTARWNRGCG